METRSLIHETSETIRRSAAEYGLDVRVSSSVSNGNEGMVKCEFPRALVHAHYLLIVRFCNLETAWAGLYLKSHSREKAAEDLRNFPARQLIDFDFPPVGGFHPYHELLEYRLRQKGVVLLKKQEAAENLHLALSEYLEILSKIPGMVTRDGE